MDLLSQMQQRLNDLAVKMELAVGTINVVTPAPIVGLPPGASDYFRERKMKFDDDLSRCAKEIVMTSKDLDILIDNLPGKERSYE